MYKHAGQILFSPNDLVAFLGCQHRTFLDLLHLEIRLEKAQDDAQAILLQELGNAHEREFLDLQISQGITVVEIDQNTPLEQQVACTRQAMEIGSQLIYQGALQDGDWHGYADFLRRVDEPSHFGSYSYEIVDTKLALQTQGKHVIQLSLYAELLQQVQGTRCSHIYVVLGDSTEEKLNLEDFAHYTSVIKTRFLEFVSNPPTESFPYPCNACPTCPWRNICNEQWEQSDHLSHVANIRSDQVKKLEDSGIRTLE